MRGLWVRNYSQRWANDLVTGTRARTKSLAHAMRRGVLFQKVYFGAKTNAQRPLVGLDDWAQTIKWLCAELYPLAQ